MEIANKRVKKEKKHPRVPIKTYKWEDVKRSRRRGGYPWTHLYKEPFYEHLDPEPWTMEGMRKAKSSSTMGKSEDFSISEVSTFDNRSSIEEIIDNPSLDIKDKNHSIKTSTSSLNLEEQEIEDDIEGEYEIIDKEEEEEETQSPGMFFLHSEESSDDISQYLDKEERGPTETSQDSKKKQEDSLQAEDESSKRKRKLSAESSNSKLSLGKKAILQKLKDTKDKIKVPKITLPTKLKKPLPKKLKSPPPEKTLVQKAHTSSRSKDVKPVYIHIPLKPPAGESDEFSHLESEVAEKQTPTRKPGSFRDLVRNIKHLQEPPIEHKHPSPIRELQEEESEESTIKESTDTVEESKAENQKVMKEEISESLVEKTVKKVAKDKQVKNEDNKTQIGIEERDTVMIVEEPPDETNSQESDKAMDIVEIKEVSEDQSDEKKLESPASDNEFFDKLFAASSSRSRTNSQNQGRRVRSKSAEPERKRKLSLESSYSRKSLSKLGLLKKLRDAKDKIKNSLSRATSKKDIKVKEEPPKPVKKTETQLKPKKDVTPVYIHIPLKPPEGQIDEYSHLERESRPFESSPNTAETEPIPSTPESPLPANGDVQLIILTAPSDDEILDYNSSDVPETPVSENKIFFPVKIHELKELAKGAVDEITASSTSKKLSPVTEEQVSPKGSLENITKEVLKESKSADNMTVDEEDGLSETKKQETVSEEVKVAVEKIITTPEEMKEQKESTILKKPSEVSEEGVIELKEQKDSQVEEKASSEEPASTVETEVSVLHVDQTTSEEKSELKSSLKGPNSPIMKKKVSFKRKSKSKSSEDEIEANNKVPDNGSQNESEEAKTDDVYKLGDIVKDTTDEKEASKWSEISDHDHDSGDLSPPNNIEIIPTTFNNTPTVVISTSEALGMPEQQNYDLSTKHVYEEIAEDSSKKSPSPQRVVFSATTDSRSSETSDKPKEGPSKFQAAFKQKANNFKTKLQNMRRPHINLPDRPKFEKPNLQRFKIEKPKWNMPKIPDTARINLPHFSLPRRQGGKKTVKRISSTESTAGDSKKSMFDFGTYPRIFKRKSKPDIGSDFGTVPRTKTTDTSRSTEDSRDSRKSATDSVRIPLHSEDSMEKVEFSVPADSNDFTQPSHIRYDEGIDSEDEYNKETKELMEERDFLSRWQRGRFNPDELMYVQRHERVTDLDSPEERNYEFSSNNGKDQHYSSGSSVGVHRQGVLEEINPDEFFLRQKGISQDNIEVGMYLSTEIREAFRNPTNALVQMEENTFNKGSHHSLPEMQSKKKPVRKPKRKKTPHASQERIPYGEEETADEELDIPPPSRPKRRSKRKRKTNEEFIPYQETIQVEGGEERLSQHRESLGILADDEREFMYENELMEGIDQPEIKITDPYKDYGAEELEEEILEEFVPEAPPRKPKNIKSRQTFEIGSALQTFDRIQTIPSHQKVPERISYHTKVIEPKAINNMNITEPEFEDREEESHLESNTDGFNSYRFIDASIEELPPAAPPRKQKSLKSLTMSENESLTGDLRANRAIFSSEKNLDEPQIEAIRTESKIIIPIETDLPPTRPSRSRSRANSKSRTGSRAASETGPASISESRTTSRQDIDSLSLHAESLAAENPQPCVEEPCTQTICDYMGYTTVDRNKPRDPPLPPPRTLQRKKRTKIDQENKFFTVPRVKSSADGEEIPKRPSRIYSTLGPGSKSITPDSENKENLEIDILQYIEQDESKDLQSEEVIEKIKSRPLPTPPRPPRKTRPLSDITSRENIMIDSNTDLQKASTREIEVYTQTEPLPDDFICEEVIQEPTDKVIIPTQAAESSRVKRSLITPTVFTHEETVTHGSLLVEPLNGAKILSDTDFSKKSTERIVPMHVESDIEETSSIPEEFHQLSNPKEQKQPVSAEMELLKAQKLQVTDLDVDTLTVNKLLATKLIVSEIDSSNIHTNEISSKTGALQVGEINLPPEVLDHIMKTIQNREAFEESEKPKEDMGEQKKTPILVSPDLESIVPDDKVGFTDSSHINLDQPQTSEEERLSDISMPETANIENIEIVEEIPLLPSEETVSENIPSSQHEIPDNPPEIPCRLENESGEPHIELDLEETSQAQEPPHRPPRQSERQKTSQSAIDISLQEPEVDDEPPPRPPQPPMGYIPSQPPSSFYALRAQKYVDDNIPVVPRRRRQVKSKQLSRSTSEESSELPPVVRRHHRRSSEPTIAQLSGQLVRACGSEANNALKRLITYILNNVFHNEDGKQDLNVMIIIVLILIAGLLLLGYGEERTVVHLHHWEYFNPPKNL